MCRAFSSESSSNGRSTAWSRWHSCWRGCSTRCLRRSACRSGAAALHLHLRLVDRTEHTRVLQLPAAMRDPKVLRTLLVLDLESHPPQAAIDIITIEVDPAPGRVLQYSLLERARP